MTMGRDPNPDRTISGSFPNTHWSLVVQAGSPKSPQARAALDQLCSAYWYPIYAFIRRKGNDPDRARDLTQEFFARLLEKKEMLASVDQGKGRFRSFLCVVCKHFLIDEIRRDKAGQTMSLISIDAHDAESRYRIEPAETMTAERIFDRVWALTLLNRVLAILAAEYANSGRSALFNELKIVLTDGKGAVRSAALAERLNTTENAINAANHRLRKRYREILEEEIAATLDDPSELDDEIRSLFDAIRPESGNR